MDLATHEDFRLANCPIDKIGTRHHPQRSMISIDAGWRCGDRRWRGPRTSPRMRQSKTMLRHGCATGQCKMRQWCRMLKSSFRSIEYHEAGDFHRLLNEAGWRLCESKSKHASEQVYPGTSSVVKAAGSPWFSIKRLKPKAQDDDGSSLAPTSCCPGARPRARG